MDFSSSVKRKNKIRSRIKIEGEYENRLQLYIYPPTDDITLEEFEKLAVTRQKLLREISNLKEKLSHGDLDRNVFRDQMKEKIKLLPLIHEEERRQDHISHYILRLAYCRSEELRRWFLSQEVELLRSRLSILPVEHLGDLIDTHKSYLPLEQIQLKRASEMADPSQAEINLIEEVLQFFSAVGPFYKAHFTSLLDLVQRRNVVVKNGYAYFPKINRDILTSLICNKYRTLLSQDLVKTASHLDRVEQDERITPLLHKLKDQYLGNDFSDPASRLGENIRLSQIDAFAKESFPPCMRHLHESLRAEHHLKHFSRLQFGLFLKSIGMSLDDALTFWREEFTKKMEVDKFEKQYAYNVRHSFGQEGKRANYTAFSCMKIITSNSPSAGDHHGCPFRHWDQNHIREKMASYGISQKQVSNITEYSQSSHYQLACQKYFETVHGLQQSGFSLEHPSQYYYESRKVRGGITEPINKNEAQTEPELAVSEANNKVLNEIESLDETVLAELTTPDMDIDQ